MKICLIAGGSSIHIRRLAGFLAASGHQVYLISSVPVEDRRGYDGRVKIYPLVRLLPRIWKISRFLSGPLWPFQVRRLLKRIRPDIVDAHFLKANGYLATFSGFHPVVLTCMGSDILVNAGQNVIDRFLSGYCLRRADAIVCRSTAVKEEIIKMGALSESIHTILIGVDTDKFAPTRNEDGLKQQLGIGHLVPVIISTRGLKPVYDLETLVRAVPFVLQEVSGARFIIAGEGVQRHQLESLADSLGVKNNVMMVGQLSHNDIPRYLASSDVYVSTSLSDGASNSLLEAMSSGLPAVVSDIPANRPWIEDADARFPIKDPAALAERIVRMLKDESLRKSAGTTNREIALNKAEHKMEMEKLFKLYRELVDRRV